MSALAGWLEERLRDLSVPAGEEESFARLLLVSDIAWSLLRQGPEAAERLLALRDDPRPPGERLRPLTALAPDWPRLRALRREESLRLAWRDVLGIDPLEQTLQETSALAEAVIEVALAWSAAELRRAPTAELAVIALGKLGGGELNYSSDVDLVFVHRQDPQGEGATLARWLRGFCRHLAETDGSGFLYRVDLRLRPFGEAGPLSSSLAALEQYFLREAREWERFAWIRARVVAGDRSLGAAALALAEPFVFRRYLDYDAFAALRRMKAMLAAEVARRELDEDIKRGAGGIRELEFVVQALQLLRGGREPALREPRILRALPSLAAAGALPGDAAERLASSYRFLRLLENRLQMLNEAQTHQLPEDPFIRCRIAAGLGLADERTLVQRLATARENVREVFAALFPQPPVVAADERAFEALLAGSDTGGLAPEAAEIFRQFGCSPAVRALSARGAARLRRVGARLLSDLRERPQTPAVVSRLVDVLAVLVRRTAYLAFLDERPAAIGRLLSVLAASPLLARLLVRAPVLLDRLLAAPVEPGDEAQALGGRVRVASDPEAALRQLGEAKNEALFDIGLAFLDGRLPAATTARRLARLAEATLVEVAELALAGLAERHGRIAEGLPFAVVGYGSLGALELSFASDLDLVFLYDPDALAAFSDGERPLERGHYLLRLVQRFLALLAAPTAAGALYEVDVRLRPEGAKGLPLISVEGFAAYQRRRARLWEHQALLRARPLFGEARTLAAFARIRAEVLDLPREPAAVWRELAKMRERLRQEHDRGGDGSFDLKQGPGGLVDLAFTLEALLLADPRARAAVGEARALGEWIRLLAEAGGLDEGDLLAAAHERLLGAALRCHLAGRARILDRPTPEIAQAAAKVQALQRRVRAALASG